MTPSIDLDIDGLKVFVHGNPETAAVWSALVEALRNRGVDVDRHVITLSPPGFGAELPADFGATTDDYLRWLIDELEHARTAAARPIDIVGHDWGAGHVYRLLDTRPDLIRSWAADVGGLLHPDYRWHDAAQAWQTPEVGEQMVEMMVALPVDERAALYAGLGLPVDVATSFAHAVGDDMGRAILALYRSAPEPVLQALARRLASATLPPGLVITATDDAYVPSELSGPVADSLGADQLVLDGLGHWWMLSDPGAAADGLLAFWSSL